MMAATPQKSAVSSQSESGSSVYLMFAVGMIASRCLAVLQGGLAVVAAAVGGVVGIIGGTAGAVDGLIGGRLLLLDWCQWRRLVGTLMFVMCGNGLN